MFKEYQSKPITRKAYEIQPTDEIGYNGKLDRPYVVIDGEPVTFVAHEKVNAGDFVVYLDENDVYHCRREVFLERNHMPVDIQEFASAVFTGTVSERTDIEEMMQELGCKGEYISSKSIIDRIDTVEFKTIHLCGQRFMYCGIKMKGGFVVTGKPSVCIDPENWREEIGKKISYENAFNEIYRLEAYLKVEGK